MLAMTFERIMARAAQKRREPRPARHRVSRLLPATFEQKASTKGWRSTSLGPHNRHARRGRPKGWQPPGAAAGEPWGIPEHESLNNSARPAEIQTANTLAETNT